MAEPQGATKAQEEDKHSKEGQQEVHSDEESEDHPLEKPKWVGYFRLPRNDVELDRDAPFLPNDK